MSPFVCCAEPNNLWDQLCTVRRRSSDTAMLLFSLPLATCDDLLSSRRSPLESLVYKVEFPKASQKTLKAVAMQPWECCLSVTHRVTPAFWAGTRWLGNHRTGADTAEREKPFNTKISRPNTSWFCPRFPVSHAPPLIVLPCEMFTLHPIHHSLLTVL